MRIDVILGAIKRGRVSTTLRGSKAATAASPLGQIYAAVESESGVTDTDMFNLKE
jgi:hypothetical protein